MNKNKTSHKKIDVTTTREQASAVKAKGQAKAKQPTKALQTANPADKSRSKAPVRASSRQATNIPRGKSAPTKTGRPMEGKKTTPTHAHARPAPKQKAAPTKATPISAPVAVEEPGAAPQAKPELVAKVVTLPPTIIVRDLATLLDTSPINIIRELMKNGVMANINQDIDFDTAAIVATDLGFEVKEERLPEPVVEEPVAPARKRREYSEEEKAKLTVRPPVVTIMGHVDHGKTSLLDVIRQSNVVASEVGGITQHIGAYQVEKQGKKITFLDTPGHEAFTAMRARGAMATDIAILVVAADDGVQPQTLEAISHARAAQVPIIVALNKIDKPTANPEAVKRQLADAGLVVEDYGGDVICVPVSAKQKIGLETLLEMILLVADMAELKANPEALATGTVIEGRLDKTKGAMATLLVQDGTLHVGDYLVIGGQAGKIRAMFDDKGQRIDVAPPSTPVAVLGLNDVPAAGETFRVVESEHAARVEASAEAMRRQEATTQQKQKVLSLDEFFARAQAGQVKELNLILKADVQGSIEPIVNSVEKLGDESLHPRFLHTGTGNINESDITLAVASKAIVLGFSVQVDAAASRLAEAEGVDIRCYDIIYKLVDDIDKALKGLLEPTYRDVTIGHAEVKQIFKIQKRQVAGCLVTDGVVARNANVRVKRGDQTAFEGPAASLRRFKEDVREVAAGMECGIGLEGFNDFAVGDVLEFYRKERVT
jgi:translation initiation factor IF-2